MIFSPHFLQKSLFLNSRPSPAPNSWRSNYSRSDGRLEKSPDRHTTHKSSEKKLPCFPTWIRDVSREVSFPLPGPPNILIQEVLHTNIWSSMEHLLPFIINGWKLKGSSTVDLDRQAIWILPWNLSTQCCLHADTLHPLHYNTYAHLRKLATKGKHLMKL